MKETIDTEANDPLGRRVRRANPNDHNRQQLFTQCSLHCG
jgi:hypothetical protein